MDDKQELTFIEAFYKFMFEFETLDSIVYEHKMLIFVASAALLGFLFIVLDYGIVKSEIRKKSFFELVYNPEKIILLIAVWTISSGFIGWIGLMLGILNDKVQSTAVAGFSWIYILSNLIEKRGNTEEIQEIIDED